jgi:hypothetical protein
MNTNTTLIPAILNPSSSFEGEVPSPSYWEDFHNLILSMGYRYSHTTPVHTPSGVIVFYHHYIHESGHGVSYRHGHGMLWYSSCGSASGRKWDGKGLPELRAHLKSKARRYGLRKT